MSYSTLKKIITGIACFLLCQYAKPQCYNQGFGFVGSVPSFGDYNTTTGTHTILIPIKVIMLDSDHNWNIDELMRFFYLQIEYANKKMAGANIRFVLLNNIVYRQTDLATSTISYSNMINCNHTGYRPAEYEDNVLNVYFVKEAQVLVFGPGAFATYPWILGLRNVMVIDKDNFWNGNNGPSLTFVAHELGHNMGLLHTFGPVGAGGDDMIGDTEFDNNENPINISAACSTFTASQPKGNIMSYYYGCDQNFTSTQLAHMRRVAERHFDSYPYGWSGRTNLNCSNQDITISRNVGGNHQFKTTGNIIIKSGIKLTAGDVTNNTGFNSFIAGGTVKLEIAGGLQPVLLKSGLSALGFIINGTCTNTSYKTNAPINGVQELIPVIPGKAYPNPFYDEVAISGKGKLINEAAIISTTGTFILHRHFASAPVIRWNGQNEAGQTVPAGIYLVRISYTDRTVETIKLVKQ
jgi:hypothetical protein